MRRIARFLLVLAVVAVGSSGFAAAGQASKADKVQICHGTASGSNPYVLISVSGNALAGHFGKTPPGHGENNHSDSLVGTDCSGEAGGVDDGGSQE